MPFVEDAEEFADPMVGDVVLVTFPVSEAGGVVVDPAAEKGAFDVADSEFCVWEAEDSSAVDAKAGTGE